MFSLLTLSPLMSAVGFFFYISLGSWISNIFSPSNPLFILGGSRSLPTKELTWLSGEWYLTFDILKDKAKQPETAAEAVI